MLRTDRQGYERMTLKLRPHHVLCMLGYAGRGYNDAFTHCFDGIVARVRNGETIELTDGTDALCATLACDASRHCDRAVTHRRDARAWRDIAALLGLDQDGPRRLVLTDDKLALLRARFADGRLRSACAACPWHDACSAEADSGFSKAVLKPVTKDMPRDLAGRVFHFGRDRDGVALTVGETDLTWPQLAEDIRCKSALLGDVPAGGRLAVRLENAAALVTWFLAGVSHRLNVQVLDPEWPADTVGNVLRILKPDALVADDRAIARPAGIPVLGPDQMAEQVPPEVSDDVSVQDRLGDLFYTGFTSGSTGFPRGFERHQASWVASFESDQRAFGFATDDVFIALGNLAHSLFLYAVMRGLYAGARTVMFPQFRPNRILDSIAKNKGTVVYGTPTQFDALALAAEQGGIALPSVRLVLSSGAKMPQALKHRLRAICPSAEICEFYGSSELSYISYARDGAAPDPSVGKPFPEVTVRILDNDFHDLKTGETGRVFVESPFRFSGYALSDERPLLQSGAALATGDVGYLDSSGYLYLVGRADRMLICSAKNVYPEEVESVLARHPSVRRAAVFGVADQRRGTRLVAVIDPADGHAISQKDLIAWCRTFLPRYKVPMRFVEMDAWPLTASHKPNLPVMQTWVERMETGARP